MELLIMVDALCSCKCSQYQTLSFRIFGYARQDRIASPREPLTAKLVANMLVKAGVDRILTLDLHAVQVQGFFDIPVDNLFTVPLFANITAIRGSLAQMLLSLALKIQVSNVLVAWLSILMLLSPLSITLKTMQLVTKVILLVMLKVRKPS